jgi:hypothetical protein
VEKAVAFAWSKKNLKNMRLGQECLESVRSRR